MSQIVEVQFKEHVNKPDSMQGTNMLRTASAADTSVGSSVIVDKIEETSNGVVVDKTTVRPDGIKVMHRSLYPWGIIKGVKYEKITSVSVLPQAPRTIDGQTAVTPQKR